MLNFSIPELAMILVIALIVFGPGKLPEVGKSLGKGLGELRRAVNNEPTEKEVTTIQAATVDKNSMETK
ncbi:Sec-independent protein translocase subunit TatA/TatB [Sporomusa acidovorans]|uniref:Sec-independent protein translocase protein TatA n=1 Tax=Sporomusa acidovorans (strain ATCC 49682 / DSM 3132 / Mol) TaxID=1123286 RepID=A0ABZ3J0V4_SPOA4|nr:twin-arginine translocase TatA/TatE family subunit [Sporomusa acidovorans]OZC21334.1 Sec-independent protein translocase protein TatAd [Sporomusa acidovorans DSM 3132]SDE57122.1 sec-independent protein translocase protein TatA [Sporomusa acidovorans]